MQPVGSAAGITAKGMLLAQNNPAIEQSRLFRETAPSTRPSVDANGNAVATGESTTTSTDDSFGAQLILKTQERPRTLVASGGFSLIYTSNVALTRRNTRNDAFAVVDAGLGWSPKLANNLEATLGVHTAIFRYFDTSELNFESLGAGVGLVWTPPVLRGFALFGRYDFTELLDSDGNEILMDHTFTLGVQKSVSFGRSHGLTFGAIGMAGISNPNDAQRQQLGAFLDYRLQLTRHLETGFLVRPAVHFYDQNGRVDFNQILSWNLRYRFNQWAEANAFLSYGLNRSEKATFDYGVLTSGGGAAVNIRF